MIALGKPLGCCVHRCDELNPSPCLPLHLTHRHAPFSQCGWFHLLACHDVRSEEHTSELQSLMRISYAVFCLKKKTNQTHHKRYSYTPSSPHTNKQNNWSR